MVDRIRIIDIPPGQAPEWVRREWVGLELPIDESAPAPEKRRQIGVEGGKAENLGGYPINTLVAIKSLRERSPQAAEWWETNIPLELIPRLAFKREVCIIVPGVSTTKP